VLFLVGERNVHVARPVGSVRDSARSTSEGCRAGGSAARAPSTSAAFRQRGRRQTSALLLWLLARDRAHDESERRHELPDLWPAACGCRPAPSLDLVELAPESARTTRLSPGVIAGAVAPVVLEGRYRLLLAALIRMQRSRRGRWALGVGSGAVVTVLALLVARHFATTSWPLSSGHPGLLVAVGVLLLFAHMLKAYGWGRLFTTDERPKPLALAAGNGGAALVGLVLPGRFDDAMRVAVVRRYRPCPAGVRTLCLSLVLLGLIDSVALAPLALAAAVSASAGNGARAALSVVAAAGVAAAALIVFLPRLAGSRRSLRFRLGRWLSPRTTSLRRASQAWALVSTCWLVRAVALFLLMGALGIGYSFPLALLFLCAGAAAAALPIGPAGAATQVGAGAAALLAAGVGASQALGVAVSLGALGVLSGAAILVFAVAGRTVASLLPARATG
jgi:uncharacterized membrane protein YbhN (UPF0104 family)